MHANRALGTLPGFERKVSLFLNLLKLAKAVKRFVK